MKRVPRLDSHQHFWRYSAADYPWMQPQWPIRRDFLPPDLAPLLAAHALDGCIAVQARQTLEESRWLLDLAEAHDIIRAVVGWVDLRSDRVEEQLAPLAARRKFAGVRHVVQDEPDDRFMLGAEFRRGISRLRQFGLNYDLLVFPRQLPAAIALVAEFPEQPFILDHIAKPPIRSGEFGAWREDIRELARAPHVMCKVSGMVTEADWAAWEPAHFRPYLDVVFGAFGAERVMYGSDWPVCLLAAEYAEAFALVDDYLRSTGTAAREAFFGGNAARVYRAG